MGTYRTRIDRTAVVRIVGQKYSKAAAKRAALATRERAQRNVIVMGLVDSGQLAQSFRVKDVSTHPLKPSFRVGSTLERAKYPEFGTRGAMAPAGKMLRFQPKGSTMFIFRKRTGPVKAYGFMKAARKSIRKADFLPGR